MKILPLILCLLLFVSFASSAQKTLAWPRNPKTGNVEFTGKRTFTGEAAKPENIQRFVREWVAKQTDDSQTASQGRFSSKGFFYEGLVMEQPGNHKFLFMCSVQIVNGGVQYKLEEFTCIYPEGQKVNDVPLEALLASESHEHQQAIQEFYKRLNTSLEALK